MIQRASDFPGESRVVVSACTTDHTLNEAGPQGDTTFERKVQKGLTHVY